MLHVSAFTPDPVNGTRVSVRASCHDVPYVSARIAFDRCTGCWCRDPTNRMCNANCVVKSGKSEMLTVKCSVNERG